MTIHDNQHMAVLMPLTSMTALGGGVQGQAALATWGGIALSHFDPGFSELLSRVEADPESRKSVPYLEEIATVTRRAHAWLHVVTQGMASDRTYLVLPTPDQTVVVGIHGDIVEWVLGGHEVLEHCLARLLDGADDGAVLLTCFDGDDAVAGLRFSDGAVEVTAADPVVFDTLTAAAHGGLGSLSRALSTSPSPEVRA